MSLNHLDHTNTNDSKTSRRAQDSSYYELQLRAGKEAQNGLAIAKVQDDSPSDDTPDIKVSNIIGDFGVYQIAVIIFAALRALSCALDGLSGPFLSPNVKHFQCIGCGPITQSNISNTTSVCSISIDQKRYDLDSSQCYFYNTDALGQQRIDCDNWSYEFPENDRFMRSLTIEQNLICDREWLKSLSNSMYFVGATLGLLFWGVISDKYGRKTAYVCSHFVTLIFGFSALFANSMTTYIMLRAINSFGMIGELIPRSIQLEIVATEYRFVCSVICQIGWAMGIILVPALSYINPDYRFILSVPVGISFLMLPWLFYLPESARWLITSKQYAKARKELRRAARINGKLTDDIDQKIERYNKQVLREESSSTGGRERLGLARSIMAIFTNLHLLKDTLSVFILLFIAEVVYFSLTLNVADLSGSLYVNYVISGLSELVSIACCGTLLAYLSRRMCLSLLLLASTVSYLLLALVNIYEEHLSMTVILGVNAFGKLTAIGNLMVIILVSQEIFPTVIRQFGTSLCITIGKAGSAVAPFTHELGQIIGQSWCFAMFSLLCLSCAIIPFIMSETGDKELPDTVVDVENGVSKSDKKRRKMANASPGKQYVAQHEPNGPITSLKYEQDLNNNNLVDIQKNNNSVKQQEIEDYLNNNDPNNNSRHNGVPDSSSTNTNWTGNDNNNNRHHGSENQDSR
uniref:Organic cation transporter 1 n=1 Tax=Aceria tosichella TaxID=561515 RepID=A0A6G1S9Q0_9ACAR